jgi:hypothetical protein
MEHNDIRHKLSEYIDGSITAEEKAAIEAHLKTCPACSDALRELQKTVEHIRSIEEVEPPVWMTQKIMAKVRSGAKEKKGLFQKFFFPLSVKLPIQAVAVLFLTVTAFYIYRNIQPTPMPSEAPVQEFAAPSPAPALRDKREEPKITKDASAPAKKVPQAPEYKALDMKLEYEKPAPPAALGKAAESAPAAAKPFAVPEPAKEDAKSQNDVMSQESRPSANRREASGPEKMMLPRQKPAAAESAGASGTMLLDKTEKKEAAVQLKVNEVFATGGLTRDAVRIAVEQQVKSLTSCIPTTQLGAKIRIKLTIDASGVVKNVEIVSREITDKAVEQCLRRIMNGWRFDANSAGKETEAVITFQRGS